MLPWSVWRRKKNLSTAHRSIVQAYFRQGQVWNPREGDLPEDHLWKPGKQDHHDHGLETDRRHPRHLRAGVGGIRRAGSSSFTRFQSFPGLGKSTYTFSAKHLGISAFSSPARWLYPLKPGGERKAEDVRRKRIRWFTRTPGERARDLFAFRPFFSNFFLPRLFFSLTSCQGFSA